MTKTRLLAIALTTLAAACTFGATRGLVTHAHLEWVKGMAMSGDGATLFVGDSDTREIVSFDAAGTEQDRVYLGDEWAVGRLTPDDTDSDAVWALHANGYTMKWESDLTPSVVNPPPQLRAIAPEYCDLDVDDRGNMYMSVADTTGDLGTVVLRLDAGAWDWHMQPVEGTGCVRLSYDDVNNTLVVLHPEGKSVHRYSDTLEYLGMTSLGRDKTVSDIDVAGDVLVGGGYDDESFEGLVWLFDLPTGDELDVGDAGLRWYLNTLQLQYYEGPGTFEVVVGGWSPFYSISVIEVL